MLACQAYQAVLARGADALLHAALQLCSNTLQSAAVLCHLCRQCVAQTLSVCYQRLSSGDALCALAAPNMWVCEGWPVQVRGCWRDGWHSSSGHSGGRR